jgi:hypothetical protein
MANIISEFFEVGDRVRLSELGEARLTRSRESAGLVVGFGHAETRVRVLLDGRVRPVTLHNTYLVREMHFTVPRPLPTKLLKSKSLRAAIQLAERSSQPWRSRPRKRKLMPRA